MKLSFLLLALLSLPVLAEQASTAQKVQHSTQSVKLLPQPQYHESWTQQEQDTINEFVARLVNFYNANKLVSSNDAETVQAIKYIHHVISSGKVEVSFSEDTLARVAAMVDHLEAARLFIEKGEDPNICSEQQEAIAPICLAQEVIWSESLINTHHSPEERVQFLEWMRSKGWEPTRQNASVVQAIIIAAHAEAQDVSPFFRWLQEQNFDKTSYYTEEFYRAALLGGGCHGIVQELVEQGCFKLNEPLMELLPLQHVCSRPLFDKIINPDTLEYLLQAGADPNLMLAYDSDEHHEDEYKAEDFEEDDQPSDDMVAFSTPIEIVFDSYRFDLIYANETHADKKRINSYLLAIDILLLYGAELEIEEDEAGDEDAESAAYAEVRKRLQMTEEELRADAERLRSLL